MAGRKLNILKLSVDCRKLNILELSVDDQKLNILELSVDVKCQAVEAGRSRNP